MSDPRTRAQRWRDALTHSGPGYDPPPTASSITDDQLEALLEERDRLRRQLDDARVARRRLSSALIASAHLLDTPFTDRPDASPWSHSIKPALARLAEALKEPDRHV